MLEDNCVKVAGGLGWDMVLRSIGSVNLWM